MELTREKSAQIVALNAKGATVEAIANKAHVSTDTVRELLGNRNILMKEWKEMNAEEKRLYINQLVYDRHKTVDEVEDLTGLAKSSIYSYLKVKNNKALPPNTAEKIVELRSQGKTHKEIADELGIGTATVNRYLHKDKPSQINEDFDKAVNEMITEAKKEPAPAATDTDSTSENIDSLYPNDNTDELKSQEPEPEMCPEWLDDACKDFLSLYSYMSEVEQRAFDLGQIYGGLAKQRGKYV